MPRAALNGVTRLLAACQLPEPGSGLGGLAMDHVSTVLAYRAMLREIGQPAVEVLRTTGCGSADDLAPSAVSSADIRRDTTNVGCYGARGSAH